MTDHLIGELFTHFIFMIINYFRMNYFKKNAG